MYLLEDTIRQNSDPRAGTSAQSVRPFPSPCNCGSWRCGSSLRVALAQICDMHVLTGFGLDAGRISVIEKSNAYLYLLRDTKKQTFPGRPPTEYGDGSREVVMISIYPPR